MKLPEEEGVPILAHISHVHSLGTSVYWEVVYFLGGQWRAHMESRTFQDGEQVIAWSYISEVKHALDTHALLRK